MQDGVAVGELEVPQMMISKAQDDGVWCAVDESEVPHHEAQDLHMR